jgi:hypothetical protein
MELADPALMQILSRFQRHLDDEALRLQGQVQQGEVDEEAFVLPLLNDLARQLQNRTRNAGRRTQHGLERSEEGQRPTSRAYPDAGEASDAIDPLGPRPEHGRRARRPRAACTCSRREASTSPR